MTGIVLDSPNALRYRPNLAWLMFTAFVGITPCKPPGIAGENRRNPQA